MSNNKHLIVIGGPTASGKTALAIGIAQHFDAPILSADSRQFYTEMTIGTAKATAEELVQAKHYFVNTRSVTEPYTVSDYEKEALQILETIFSQQDVAVMAGGSGMFIKAVCEGLDEFPEVSEEARGVVEALFEKGGLEALQQALEKADPDYYKTVDLQNSRRLIRALCICESSGKPYSSFLKKNTNPRPFTAHYICLNMDREKLYDRINRRVDLMLANGLLEEARELQQHKELRSLQTVGYAELFDHFDGKQDLETAVELIKRNSRRYAKRQLTWFRRDQHWKWFKEATTEEILQHLKADGIT
ncbi:MAG: tRNA dimethylallyltransferase [Gammaproteobacteria bacterium]|jgi:tRNA dimethylallyltransferase